METEKGTAKVSGSEAGGSVNVGRVEMMLEVVVIPVSDVDRAEEFYGRLGWRLDADFPFDNGFRVVQFTPPGSGCSIQFGANMTSAAPGSARLYLIVSDIEVARGELVARGVEVSDVFHAQTPGAQFQPGEHCADALAVRGLRVAVVERELGGGECSYTGASTCCAARAGWPAAAWSKSRASGTPRSTSPTCRTR